MRIKSLLIALALALGLTACGDANSAERPTVEEFTAALNMVDEGDGDALTDETEACMAELFIGSDLSNNYLRETVDNPNALEVEGVFAEEDEQILDDLFDSPEFMDCLSLSF